MYLPQIRIPTGPKVDGYRRSDHKSSTQESNRSEKDEKSIDNGPRRRMRSPTTRGTGDAPSYQRGAASVDDEVGCLPFPIGRPTRARSRFGQLDALVCAPRSVLGGARSTTLLPVLSLVEVANVSGLCRDPRSRARTYGAVCSAAVQRSSRAAFPHRRMRQTMQRSLPTEISNIRTQGRAGTLAHPMTHGDAKCPR